MERHIGIELRNISNLLKREFSDLPCLKMDKTTGLHGIVVEYLLKNKDVAIYQRDVEEKFAMRRSTASRMLQLMEKNELITRESVGEDARLKRIVLTDKAIQIHDMVYQFATTLESKMKQGIPEEDIQAFFRVIDKIKQNLE